MTEPTPGETLAVLEVVPVSEGSDPRRLPGHPAHAGARWTRVTDPPYGINRFEASQPCATASRAQTGNHPAVSMDVDEHSNGDLGGNFFIGRQSGLRFVRFTSCSVIGGFASSQTGTRTADKQNMGFGVVQC